VAERPLFEVQLADLERGPKEVTWAIPDAWLKDCLRDTEAEPTGAPGEATLELTDTGGGVLVRGSLHVEIQMPCAETLDPAVYRVAPEVFLSLERSDVPEARVAKSSKSKRKAEPLKKKGGWEETPELVPEEAGSDTFSGESVVLDPFLREFILLDLPMVPLREDLRSGKAPAIAAPPQADQEQERPIDPRLMPLAAIRERLGLKKE